ncbi:hypothetical protein P691DRAFT_715349 [Macrolepiota fuliginosa MF-IS2]|uniref:Uncharacterized protein n=1 Tax=Macrolepiota fuliginosa MF-IS2 TaxID=1400762 RepID=A0A9P5X0I1_9AGAR|nr:hypothetical protein P691DRAFT_715349 [Macrolepiota fuliginosa MF-IS2]
MNNKNIQAVGQSALEGDNYLLLSNTGVGRGKNVFPVDADDQRNIAIRFRSDGQVTQDGKVMNKLQAQVNNKYSSKASGVIADVFVPQGGTREEVQAALEKGLGKKIKNT